MNINLIDIILTIIPHFLHLLFATLPALIFSILIRMHKDIVRNERIRENYSERLKSLELKLNSLEDLTFNLFNHIEWSEDGIKYDTLEDYFNRRNNDSRSQNQDLHDP